MPAFSFLGELSLWVSHPNRLFFFSPAVHLINYCGPSLVLVIGRNLVTAPNSSGIWLNYPFKMTYRMIRMTTHILHNRQYTRAKCQVETTKTAITLSRNRGKKLNQCQPDKRTPQLNPGSWHLHPYSRVSDACPAPTEGEKQRVSGGIQWSLRGISETHRGRERSLCGVKNSKDFVEFWWTASEKCFLRTIVVPENKQATTAPVIHAG